MKTPYSEKKFIELVSNKNFTSEFIDPQTAIEEFREIFEFLEKLPGTFCFIYDFFNFKYILVSKSTRTVLGVSEDVILDGGFQKALEYFHPDDRDNIGHIHKELFSFLHQLPPEDLTNIRYDFNYRILNSQGNYIKILQQSTITAVHEGRPLYDLSTCTDITLQKRDNRLELTIYKKSEEDGYKAIFNYVVPSTIGFDLSVTEFKILKLISEGLSSQQIADACYRSLHTVNNHRRSILSKTKSSTVAEAILKVDL